MLSGGSAEHASIGHSNHINDELDLLSLVGAGKQRETREELNHNATKTPHIDLLSVREDSKHDIGGSVESTLNVGVHDFIFEASRSKVSDCYSTFVLLLHQDVLRLEIAMDDSKMFEVPEARQKLDSESSNQSIFEALVVVHLDEFIEIDGI